MKKIYFSFKTRLTILIISLIIIIPLSIYLFLDSFNLFDKSQIKYKEENYMDYKVSLKENNLFDETTMSSNMNYIASLIDKISINYSYKLKPEEHLKGTYKYSINASLNIIDHLTGELYYKKDYILIDTVPEYILKSDLKLNNNIDIDYNYFKDIATALLPYYGEQAKANLQVEYKVEKNLDTTSYYNEEINNPSSSYIIIPLTNEDKNIRIESKNTNEEKILYLIQQFDKNDDTKLYISIILYILIIDLVVRLLKLLNTLKTKHNNYDKELHYIKTKYNKIIVDIDTQVDFNEYKVTKIREFDELIDLRNSFKEPIRFFEVTPHLKSHFFIIHRNEIFIYTLKEVDLKN